MGRNNSDYDLDGLGDFGDLLNDDEDAFLFESDEEDDGNSIGNSSFGNSFDFDTELGEELEFASDALNIEQDTDVSEDDTASPEEKIAMIRKTALFAIGAGIVIFLAVMVVGRLIINGKNAGLNIVNETKQSQVSETRQVQSNETKQVSAQSSDKWVKINGDTSIKFDNLIESVFTVTKIEHYAMVTNSENDKQVKSILYGTIDGLYGTYSMEIPFDKANKLKISNSFKIEYSMYNNGNYMVIGNVHYQ